MISDVLKSDLPRQRIVHLGAARVLWNDASWMRGYAIDWSDIIDERFNPINGWKDLGATKSGWVEERFDDATFITVSFAEVSLERIKVLYKDFDNAQIVFMWQSKERYIVFQRFFDVVYEGGLMSDPEYAALWQRRGECSAYPVAFCVKGG